MTTGADWLLWQLADSAFPLGGFAHSGGLEAAWQQGEVRSSGELAGFIESSLDQTAHGAVPFLTAAHAEPRRFDELDSWCDAFLTNHVTNRASRQQGQSLLMACERVFSSGTLKEFRAGLTDRNRPGHLAPGFGVVTRWLEIDRASAVRVFLFLNLRGLIAGAVRLGLIGPLEGQAVQYRLSPAAEAAAERGGEFGLNDLAQTAPLIDLWQGAQDRLYSRLFQS
jgi:urease accessory protein